MSRAHDRKFLARAFALARRVHPRATSPNPRVGCILVKGDRVVAQGAHLAYGKPHAEPNTLAIAGLRAAGATAYVTMEPCAPFPGKKTPSCAETLAAAGISRVVCAALDPNPKVAGRGLAHLRRAGAKIVRLPEFQAAAEALNRGFYSRMLRGRPWVILKTALSLDGKAAAASGKSRWVTGKEARSAVHRMRADLDAILVGAGTVLADNPRLTSHGAGKNPLRVVLAGRRKLSPRARIFDASAPTLTYRKQSLSAVLHDLGRRGVGTVLVEGGPTLHASFLRAGLVDEARVFIAPKLLSGARDAHTAPKLRTPRLSRLGDDWLIQGFL
ncbi:MAG: bifunctional diaminohydroxyphosphoribosylaminopyrimidine deaminase/5-amino-6-(5-phosphoribosylamino)uracil reductase RibD [Elusimicrobiota bacterium]